MTANFRPQRLNWIVNKLGLNRLFVKPQLDAVLTAATTATGLYDFGEDDWQEPLQLLLAGYATTARLTPLGQLIAGRIITGLLVNRLRLQATVQQQSKCPPVTDPLIILGLPRTGSTLLHELLSRHPQLRAPLFWEADNLPRGGFSRWLDQAKSGFNVGLVNTLVPSFRQIHPLAAKRPHECVTIQALAFRSMQFHAIHRVSEYSQWLEQCDWAPAYLWHERYLRVLQGADKSRRWILKAPGHMRGIEALLARYPQAQFVQLHRTPLQTVPSMASLYAALRTTSSEVHDKAEIGSNIVREWRQALARVQQVRLDPAVNARFCDLSYEELVGDPVRCVQRICEFSGTATEAPLLSGVRDYLIKSSRRSVAKHQYSLAEFGLSADTVSAEFASYLNTYIG